MLQAKSFNQTIQWSRNEVWNTNNNSHFLFNEVSVRLEIRKLEIRKINPRPRNVYGTVANIKVISVDSFKQLEVANKVDYVTS